MLFSSSIQNKFDDGSCFCTPTNPLPSPVFLGLDKSFDIFDLRLVNSVFYILFPIISPKPKLHYKSGP